MKKFIKEFALRGMTFAWGGPAVLAIVWFCLGKAGAASSLTVGEAVLGVFSTLVMAFIAAGISIVYQMEKLPKAFAGLIQFGVLYLDYLGFYLLNGWLPVEKVWIFTGIFVVGFIGIWLSIFIPIKVKVDKLNRMMKN